MAGVDLAPGITRRIFFPIGFTNCPYEVAGRAKRLKTTIYIPDQQMAELEAASRREQRPKAEIIRDALGEYLCKSAPRKPQSRGIFEDHEVDSTNLDEWLRENWHPV